jgi:hypothetical protein
MRFFAFATDRRKRGALLELQSTAALPLGYR